MAYSLSYRQGMTVHTQKHIVQVQEMRVDIETCSELSAGQTVCDRWGTSIR